MGAQISRVGRHGAAARSVRRLADDGGRPAVRRRILRPRDGDGREQRQDPVALGPGPADEQHAHHLHARRRRSTCSSPPATRCTRSASSADELVLGAPVVAAAPASLWRGGSVRLCHRPRVTAAVSAWRSTLAEARPIVAALGDSAPPALRDAARSGRRCPLVGVAEAARRGHPPPHRDGRRGFGRQSDAVRHRASRAGPARRRGGRGIGIERHALEDVMDGRLADLVAAIESPGARRAAAIRAPGGRAARDRRRASVSRGDAAISAGAALARAGGERAIHAPARGRAAADPSQQRAAHATLYRDRGLSSDTSLRVDFALDQALRAVRDTRRARAAASSNASRVVGPGLDFVDKAQGYDFYPVQMIQPFALADSLRRLGHRPASSAHDAGHQPASDGSPRATRASAPRSVSPTA